MGCRGSSGCGTWPQVSHLKRSTPMGLPLAGLVKLGTALKVAGKCPAAAGALLPSKYSRGSSGGGGGGDDGGDWAVIKAATSTGGSITYSNSIRQFARARVYSPKP